MKKNIKLLDLVKYNFIFFIPIIFCYYVIYVIPKYYRFSIYSRAILLLLLCILLNILLAIFEQTIYKKYFIENQIRCTMSDFIREIEKNDQILYKIAIINTLKIYGWTFLFVIPGIVKTLEYSRQILVHVRNPHINNLEEIKIISRDEMRGKKLHLFGTLFLYSFPIILLGQIVLSIPTIVVLINLLAFAIARFTQIYFHLNNLYA